jgi:hypothetical protein
MHLYIIILIEIPWHNQIDYNVQLLFYILSYIYLKNTFLRSIAL